MRKLSLLLLVVFVIFTFSCKNEGVDKEELKEELRKEMKDDKSSCQDIDSKEKAADVSEKASDGIDDQTKKIARNPLQANFDAKALHKLILIGQNNIIKFYDYYVQIESFSADNQKIMASYNSSSKEPILKDAVNRISANELTVGIHQNFAIGGEIIIKKQACTSGYKTGYQYSFEIKWEGEKSDSGCAFHLDEEYEITTKVESTAFGTGGSFFMFRDSNGIEYSFYQDSRRGTNLMDFFPGLEPMNSKNPFKNMQYRVFYKFFEVEDHRSYRVEPIVTYIEKI